MLKILPLLALALLALGFQSNRDEPAFEEEAWDEASIATLEKMQGGWKLVQLKDPSLDVLRGARETGYAVIAGGYMSVEIHVGWPQTGRRGLNSRLRAGTHRITMLPGLRMRLTSLIGSFSDDTDFIKAEPPGRTRHYQYTFSGDTLILLREDGYEVHFARMVDPSGRVDIYGRPFEGEGEEDDEEEERPPLRRRRR